MQAYAANRSVELTVKSVMGGTDKECLVFDMGDRKDEVHEYANVSIDGVTVDTLQVAVRVDSSGGAEILKLEASKKCGSGKAAAEDAIKLGEAISAVIGQPVMIKDDSSAADAAYPFAAKWDTNPRIDIIAAAKDGAYLITLTVE